MALSTALGFPYPEDTDYITGADVPKAVRDLANQLNTYLTGKYALISIRYITSGVSFTPTSGVDALYVECVGGGGAGGGAATGATNGTGGGGGGGGGYAAVWATTMKSPFTVSIGAGGVQVSGAAGGNGTDTTFDSPSICTAKGGGGGGLGTVGAAVAMGGTAGPGGSGSTAVGDFKAPGGIGGWGIALVAAQVASGGGGASFFGGGARPLHNGTFNGNSGDGYGAGGSGATIVSGGASGAGGGGSNGVIRVWEFKKGG